MQGDLTQLLNRASGGDERARRGAIEAVYERLRELASSHVVDHAVTLQPTVLIHEAYLRLFGRGGHEWGSRGQFYAVASKAMRHVAVDYARRRKAAKRGEGWQRVTLSSVRGGGDVADDELLDLNDALERLERASPRQASVVEMRFFGEMTNAQVAEALGVSERTVQLDWRAARAWIRAELDGERAG